VGGSRESGDTPLYYISRENPAASFSPLNFSRVSSKSAQERSSSLEQCSCADLPKRQGEKKKEKKEKEEK
jgi:hypothetical protein